MTVALDPTTARLRLDAGSFETLVAACVEEGVASSGEAAALRAAGVLDGSGPHRVLRPALGAVLAPACQLRMTVDGRSTSAVHQGWVSPTVAALLLDVGGGAYDFLAVPPDFLPASLARVARLGPRRVGPRSPRPMGPGGLGDLTELGGDGAWSWRVECTWPDPTGGARGVSLSAVDGPEGLWLVDEEAGVAHPTAATAVWLLLATLLPTDEQLGGGAPHR